MSYLRTLEVPTVQLQPEFDADARLQATGEGIARRAGLKYPYLPAIEPMLNDRDRPGQRLVVDVTGMPAAGKSTVTRLIASQLKRSARLDGDVMNEMITSGRVWALGEPADEAARQVELCNHNLCDLAGNFVDAGSTAVIDWLLPTSVQLQSFVNHLQPHTRVGRDP